MLSPAGLLQKPLLDHAAAPGQVLRTALEHHVAALGVFPDVVGGLEDLPDKILTHVILLADLVHLLEDRAVNQGTAHVDPIHPDLISVPPLGEVGVPTATVDEWL